MTRAAIALAMLLATGAWATGDQFDADPTTDDGGGGIAFDGSPRFTNHACDACHTGGPSRVKLALEADDPAVFTEGWEPKHRYHLRVVLHDATRGAEFAPAGDACGPTATPYVPCDQNGFALEIANAAGTPVGVFAPVDRGACATAAVADAAVYVMTDGHAVISRGLHYGIASWDFCWTAPGAGSGLVSAYVSAVDGNGGDGTAKFPADAVGDDVVTGIVALPERAVGGAESQVGGCNAVGGDLGPIVALVIALATAFGGCVRVRPHQREVLARKQMKFSPDPAEDELDLHMQESREGSSGGYGSSGGGCGCN